MTEFLLPDKHFNAKPSVAGLPRTAIRELFKSLGEPLFRGDQTFEGLYKKQWTSWEAFTMLSKELRIRLEQSFDIAWPALCNARESNDGSTKYTTILTDGSQIEGVFMPFEKRRSICISSQVGCAMGCTFCATGQMGLIRNLNSMEIVGQIMAMIIDKKHQLDTPINILFMGMGEPLHNLDNVMQAFEIITDKKGLAIPPRRITLSTSGLVSGIEKLASYSSRPRLALSLNATTDTYRSKIMPINKTWDLASLTKSLCNFPLEHNERITLEYVLLKGETDNFDDALRLAAFASNFPSKVNLIPFNEHEGTGFKAPTEEKIEEFCKILSKRKITVSVRRSRGQDIAGACGQLIREINQD